MKISPVSVLLLASLVVCGLGSELRGATDVEDNDERELIDIADHPRGNGGPAFLPDDQVPPGLLNNPSSEVGVDFQRGSKPRAQLSPNLKKKPGAKILGLDNTIIDLDTEDAERINIYNPEQYKPSRDGTYVTHKETGEKIPLTVFYREDNTNDVGVTFSTDNNGDLINVRVEPRKMERGKPVQNFQRLDDTDVLVGYLDEDIDLSDVPPYGEPISLQEKPIPTDLLTTKMNNGNRRRAQSSHYPKTHFGKTCDTFDFLDVGIVTDKAFMREYPDHKAYAQAIVVAAHEIYWLESCVFLSIWRYENTVEKDWWWEERPEYTRISGCSSDFGAIDMLKFEVMERKDLVYRDAWHMFTNIDFLDGGVIGCAWRGGIVCGSKEWGYGVESMAFTNSLRLQAVVFAHELAHNLNIRHLPTTNGFYVMEPFVNYAPLGFHRDVAAAINKKLIESEVCGWFDDPTFPY